MRAYVRLPGVRFAERRIEHFSADRGQDFSHHDSLCRPSQRISAFFPSNARDEPVLPQRAEQLRGVGLRNSLRPADFWNRDRSSPADLHQAPESVFFVRAEFHFRFVTFTTSKPRSNPNSSFAASDIRDRSHGGSHTSSTFASVIPGTARTAAST